MSKTGSTQGLSVSAYARHRGVSRGAVQKAIKQQRIHREADGTIDPIRADREWSENTNGRNATKGATCDNEVALPTGAELMSFSAARAAKESYLAHLRRIEYEEKEGLLVQRASVQSAWFDVLRLTRNRMLNVPDRIADALAVEDDAAVVHAMLMREIITALSTLSDEVAGLGQ